MKYAKFVLLFVFVVMMLGCKKEDNSKETINFYYEDGVYFISLEINKGKYDEIVFPNAPVKEGYEFVEWEKKTNENNVSYYMKYDKKSFKINFYYEGLLIHSEDVLYLESAKFSPTAMEGYSFTFDKDVSSITSDLNVNIKYEKNKYNVVFKYNDNILDSKVVEHGTDLSDYTYLLDGYVFNGWDINLTNITSDMIVNGNYELINYDVSYELNNYKLENIQWNSKEEFINEFYNDFYNYLKDNYVILGIIKDGTKYSFSKNGVTVTFETVDDIKNVNIYDFEKTLGHLIYAPCERNDNEAITPVFDENYFLNSGRYLEKYKDLDRYFLNAILNNYTAYSKTYEANNGRVQIFFRFQQWQQGTNIPVFDSLPFKNEITNSFDVNNENILEYNVEKDGILKAPVGNFKFLGWYDNEYFVGERIEKLTIGNFKNNNSIKLYAMWDYDTSIHEVTFMGAGSTVLGKYFIEDGEKVVAPEVNELLGFTFYKWDKDYSNITSDIVINALYKPIVYYISFDSYFYDIEFDKLDKYTILDNYELPILEKEGYLFLGWFDSDGNRIEKTTYGDLSVTAKWIKYDVDNGVIGNGTIQMVSSEGINRDLYVDRSMNVYVKKGSKYINPYDVEFTIVEKDGKATIDENGFLKAIKAGKILIIATYMSDACCLEVTIKENSQTKYIGHTGCRGEGIVQNTESAFIEGTKRGYYALECDVRVSKEGVYYIHHDDVFLTSGTVMPFVSSSLSQYGLQVNGLQASQRWDTVLSKLLVHKNGDDSVVSNLITVEDYLKICKENNVKPLLELKWTTGINSNDQSNLAGLVELVKKYEIYEDAIFMTSMKNCLTYLRENYPDANLQFLSGASTTTDSNIEWCINNRISLDASSGNVTSSIVNKMHEAYLYVNSYTVNSQATANSLINLAVDYITTDDLR